MRAGAPGRRTLRDRKVSQRVAVVDESTRQQVRAWPGRSRATQLQASRLEAASSAAATASLATPGWRVQATQARLDALEADNDVGEDAGLAASDDEYVLPQDDDEGDEGVLG